jgi:hypothetical protein
MTGELATIESATPELDRVVATRAALERARDTIPMALYKGLLRTMAKELRDCERAVAECETAGIEGWEFLPAGMLRRGARVWVANRGEGELIAIARGTTGLMFAFEETGEQDWLNVAGPDSLVVVIP